MRSFNATAALTLRAILRSIHSWSLGGAVPCHTCAIARRRTRTAMLHRAQQFGIDSRQPRQRARIQAIIFSPALGDSSAPSGRAPRSLRAPARSTPGSPTENASPSPSRCDTAACYRIPASWLPVWSPVCAPKQFPLLHSRRSTHWSDLPDPHQWSAVLGKCFSHSIGRGRDTQLPGAPRTDPYGRSLAHTAPISDGWRRSVSRGRDGARAVWESSIQSACAFSSS